MKEGAQELQRMQGFEKYGQELQQLALDVDSPVLIMIIGEFSTGKSTFINALVGKEITTVNDTPTTAVITKLCYGARERITVHFTNGRTEEHSFSELRVLTAESNANHDALHQDIEYVEVAMPLPILQKINIIDSPGLNVDKKLHIETTKRYMDKADTVFWMFSIDSLGKQTELDAIKALSPRLKPIAIVNKIDEIDEEEDESVDEILDNFRRRIRNEVSQIIGISAKLALDGKLKNNRTYSQESNIQAVYDVLEQTIIPSTATYKVNSLLESLASFVFHTMISLIRTGRYSNYAKEIEEKREHKMIQNLESRIVANLISYAKEKYSAGNLSAQMFLGIMMYYGVGIEKNIDQAIDLLESLPSFASKDGALKEDILYTHFKGTKEYPKMMYWLKKGADAGRENAIYRLAECYKEGIGVEKDLRQAVSYLIKAYDLGNSMAASELGLYGELQQLSPDTLKLLQLAGEEDCVDAQIRLFKYYDAKGDTEAKQHWLQEAGMSNSGYAQFELGTYFATNHANDGEALKWFKKAFENQYPGSLEKVCLCYYEGARIERNDKNANYWYRKGAEAGVVKALVALGEQYVYGWGVKRDYKIAIQWLRAAVAKANTDSMYLLAICYKHGLGVRADYQQYLTYMKKSASLGNVYAKITIAYLEGTKDRQAQQKLIQLADAGISKAQFFLGLCREKGMISDQGDYIQDYKNAAMQENDMALVKLGNLYLHGLVKNGYTSIPQDKAAACRYFERAAAYQNSYAQNALGECYEFGNGVTKNYDTAIYWYTLAAESLQKNALYHLSCAYRKESPAKANDFLKMAAESGHTQAQVELAQRYEKGYDVSKNMNIAILWYAKAAKGGNALAQYRLGELYVPQDAKKSFEWYLKAAEQGIADAQYQVALAYGSGKGVTKDEKVALKWLEKAGNNNQIDAIKNMCTYLHEQYGENPNSMCVTWYEKGAAVGFASAQVWLGDCYRLGNGRTESVRTALSWYEKAAEQGAKQGIYWAGMLGLNQKPNTKAVQWLTEVAVEGNTEAQYVLGKAYYEGKYITQDVDKAFSFLQSAAYTNHVGANYLLGQCYYFGKGVSANVEKAFAYFQTAANQGYVSAQYMVGLIFENHGDTYHAFSWYRKAAAQGQVDAAYKVGMFYRKGIQVSQNVGEAEKWFEKAARKQHKDATYQLCLLCYSGIQKTDEQCFEWYLKGASLGYADVQCWTADCYRLGKGVQQDLTKAIQYYDLARRQNNVIASAWWGQLTLAQHKGTAWNALLFSAQKGNADAQFWLGQYYFQGKFVVQAYAKAVEYFMLAAKQGHIGASFYLGITYFYGKGVNKDNSLAFNYYLEAAKSGNPRAQYMVGKCYEQGLGIAKNDESAFDWYLKAAKNGVMVAKNKVGICYASGRGTPQNTIKAKEWLEASSQDGNVSSEFNLLLVNMLYHSDVREARDNTIELLQKMARLGNTWAQYVLCCKLYDGSFYAKMLKPCLYKECASQGFPDVMYWQYREFEPNNIELLMQSAQKGYGPAQSTLAKYYYDKGNKKEWLQWVQKGANANDVNAIYMLAWAYWHGEEVTKDQAKAYQLFSQIKSTCKAAEYMVGICLFNGLGTTKDRQEAVKHYRSASEANYGEAQNALGCCYYNGTGIEKNIERAATWFDKASRHGSNAAKQNVAIARKSLALADQYGL